MQKLTSLALGVVFALTMGAVGRAQGAIHVPSGILKPGESIKVGYSNPLRAKEKVTVEVDDGGYPTPGVVSVEIELDENGEGSVVWIVPEWVVAIFNAPNADEVTRFIE